MHLSLKRTLFIFSLAALIVGLAFTPVRAAINEIVWRKTLGDKFAASLVATDRHGNVIVVGTPTEYGTDLPEDGRAIIKKMSGGGRVLWTDHFGRVSDDLGFEGIQDMAIDSDGNIYILGQATSFTDDDPWSTSSLIIKLGPKGGHHWTLRFPKDLDAKISGIGVGPGGNLYVVGFAWEALPNQTMSNEAVNAFIRKYNPNGKIYWTRQFGLKNSAYGTAAYDVAVGPGGGVYLVGNSWTSGAEYALERDGLFLRKYSPRGGIYWTRRVNRREPYDIWNSRVVVDRAGGVTIVAGSLDDWSDDQTLIVRYSHKGKRLWTRVWDRHWPGDVAVDRDRNIYVAGTSTSDKAFIRKYDANGSHRWIRYFANGFATSVAADSENNLFVTRIPSDISSGPSTLVKFRR